MKIKYGNLFGTNHQYICFTTNGYTTVKEGFAVCGRGIALALSKTMDGIKRLLGDLIKKNGNCVQYVDGNFISFPVKPISKVIKSTNEVVGHARNIYKPGDNVPGFHMKADLMIIKRSCEELVKLADENAWGDIAIPRPGCGAGELKWENVYPVIAPILDNRFVIYTQKPNTRSSCFIFGSMSIKKLTLEMEQVLEKLLTKDIQIIIGDSHGLEHIVKEYFSDRGYPLVHVYHTDLPKYTCGYKSIKVPGKDITRLNTTMADKANYALALWDGESPGTKKNMDYVESTNKYLKVLRSID